MIMQCEDAGACAAACDAGSGEQCRLLANSLIGKDDKRAAELLTRACDLRDATGCIGMGRLAEHAGDDARAAGLYERACTMGDKTGCYNQALMLEKGKGVAKDEKRALSLYSDVCAAGAQSACEAAERLRSKSAR